MSAMSDYLEDALINHIFRDITFTKPSAIYIGLTGIVPVDSNTGATIDEIDGTAYARVLVGPGASDWDDPTAAGDTENTAAVTFAAAGSDWGWVSGVVIADAISTGNVLLHGSLTTPREVLDGDTFKFNIGALDVTLA